MIPWNVYPRPRMKRDSFLCLNGTWDFSVCPPEDTPQYLETIQVPFCPQSRLSGIGRTIPQSSLCHYRRHFTLPEGFVKEKVLLHFGAVDQQAAVTLNGHLLGTHTGGYLPFSFDITPWLQAENVLTVAVSDHLDDAVLPYGKQKEKRGGMWYTPVTGIWQTVWLESVCNDYIHDLQVTTQNNTVYVKLEGTESCGTLTLENASSWPVEKGQCTFSLDQPVMWSPENPHLYRFSVTTDSGDSVQSYFAFRTLSVETISGMKRLCLNGKPFFFHGLLDQGYFPDGIFTPEKPEDYERDVLTAKALGFNLWEAVVQWTQETFHFGPWGDSRKNDDLPYASLQEALAEDKITAPLVPNWIPKGYELVNVDVKYHPSKTIYKAKYIYADQYIIITVQDYFDEIPVYVEQNDGLVEEYIVAETTYYLFEDIDLMKVKWVSGSYECDILGNITIDELKAMIDSIEKG